MTDARSFGAWLRRERERRDITIRWIADRTKIGGGLLEALERGDVSRWPGGIYRRAFMRSYAEAIGIDVDIALANFERLFPAEDAQLDLATLVATQQGTTKPAKEPAKPIKEQPVRQVAVAPPTRPAATADSGLRLQLAANRVTAPPTRALKKAAQDLGLVLACGLAGLFAAGAIGFWCAAAIAATFQHVVGILGYPIRPIRRRPDSRDAVPAMRPLAPVVPFTGEEGRPASRRARARRVAATLSAVTAPAASFRRRRAARS